MKGGTLHQKMKSRFIYNFINETKGKTNLPMLEANYARSEWKVMIEESEKRSIG